MLGVLNIIIDTTATTTGKRDALQESAVVIAAKAKSVDADRAAV